MTHITRRRILGRALAGTGLLVLSGLVARAAPAMPVMQVFRTPSCGCCGAWIEKMRAAGLTVQDEMLDDLSPMKSRLGIPAALESCHTATIAGYAIEGHVPAADIKRLLADRPLALGLAVAGMPIGSPGMEQGGVSEPFETILFSRSGQSVFSRHNRG